MQPINFGPEIIVTPRAKRSGGVQMGSYAEPAVMSQEVVEVIALDKALRQH